MRQAPIQGQFRTKLTRFQNEVLVKELRQEAAQPQLERLPPLGVRDHPPHEIGLLKDVRNVKYFGCIRIRTRNGAELRLILIELRMIMIST